MRGRFDSGTRRVTTTTISVSAVRYVAELYPRLKPSDETIARYEGTLEDLPPIVVARDGVLVDGYHRWQAHLRQGRTEIAAEDLGNLSDAEIFNQSIERNAHHGMSLSRDDKRNLAPKLWQSRHHLKPAEAVRDIARLLAVSDDSVRGWTQKIREQEKEDQQARAWDEHLNCKSQREIAALLGVTQPTISEWLDKKSESSENLSPPEPHMAFDSWSYGKYDGDSSYFGKLHPGVAENLLWLYTDPGQTVVDPFCGAGTMIHVAKKMGRRVWASDRMSAVKYPTLPIHTHDITTGWPESAPAKCDLVFLDPPYWQQAKGRYSDDPEDLGNMELSDFYAAWELTVKAIGDRSQRLAYIVSPAECKDENRVEDLAIGMLDAPMQAGWRVERRIIVPYSTQQATGQQVDWARREKKLLKMYRDLVVMTR